VASERLNPVNDALRTALALAKRNPEEALLLLDAAIQKARDEGNAQGTSLLARHAGVLWTTHGDLERAHQCYQEALRHDPTSAHLHLANADVLERLKNLVGAEESLVRAEQLARDAGDMDLASAAASAVRRVQATRSAGSDPEPNDS